MGRVGEPLRHPQPQDRGLQRYPRRPAQVLLLVDGTTRVRLPRLGFSHQVHRRPRQGQRQEASSQHVTSQVDAHGRFQALGRVHRHAELEPPPRRPHRRQLLGDD